MSWKNLCVCVFFFFKDTLNADIAFLASKGSPNLKEIHTYKG